MNDKRGDPKKGRQNFDLTNPNYSGDENDSRGPADLGFDKTMVNRPAPAQQDPRAQQPPAGKNKYDLTMVNYGGGFEGDETGSHTIPPQQPPPQRYEQPPQAQPVQPTKQSAKGGIPAWVWIIVAGVAMFFVIGGIGLFIYLTSKPSFTLKVYGAPPGAKVYVDDISGGLPQKDGTILYEGLIANKDREIRVSAEGCQDWKTTVRGQKGEVLPITAKNECSPAATNLPNEIDYNGPMLLVAAGPFPMGSNNFSPDEKPEHQLEPPGYYIDKFEVTNEQYRKFCDAKNHPKPVNPYWDLTYFENNPQMPVMGISYEEAASYAAWALKRLPSESEWEKAASWGPKATKKRIWPWGDNRDQSVANIGTPHPTNVGQYANGSSVYGAIDMSGNALEWVDGFYRPYPGNTVPNPGFSKNLRVARGGSFGSKLEESRTTTRFAVLGSLKTENESNGKQQTSLIGFRCAISVDDPKLREHLKKLQK